MEQQKTQIFKGILSKRIQQEVLYYLTLKYMTKLQVIKTAKY